MHWRVKLSWMTMRPFVSLVFVTTFAITLALTNGLSAQDGPVESPKADAVDAPVADDADKPEADKAEVDKPGNR